MITESINQQFLSSLDNYRDKALINLLAAIPDRQPKRHLYDLIPIYPKRGGKGFRPALCLATCKLFGGTEDEAMNSAIAIELLHNAFLVHDDIEDESEERRGSPTLHSIYGIPVALNVGDAINVLAIESLMRNLRSLGSQLTWQVFNEIQYMALESVEGQAMELGWRMENNCDLSERDYLRMVLKKTCWYTCIHPIRVGALIGSKGKANLDALNRFGYYLGAAFQIQDDLLNLNGEKNIYGKEICGDLQEGKRTLILIQLLKLCNAAEKKEIRNFLSLSRIERTSDKIDTLMFYIEKYDCINFAKNAAYNLVGAALKEFYSCFAGFKESEEKRFLENMILYMITRDK